MSRLLIMKPIINIQDAMEWLDQKLEESKYLEEDAIIEWIQETIWECEDIRNSK